jgi:hypothetical protein
MNNINKERFILLDLLRFILAAIVVLYHYFYLSSIYGLVPVLNSSFKYLYICGYLGVHIFFIVSGFVILHTAQNRSWVEFIKARIGRLLPGFMIVSTIGFLFCLLIPNVPHTNNIYLKDFFFNFFGISIFPKMNQFFNVVFVDELGQQLPGNGCRKMILPPQSHEVFHKLQVGYRYADRCGQGWDLKAFSDTLVLQLADMCKPWLDVQDIRTDRDCLQRGGETVLDRRLSQQPVRS